MAAQYNLDEQCEEEISPKLAGIVNKLLRNRLNEDKLKEKLNKRTRPKNCDNIAGRAVARALIGGGGVYIHIFRFCPTTVVSFEIKLISKEASRAKPEYMNTHLPPQLAF